VIEAEAPQLVSVEKVVTTKTVEVVVPLIVVVKEATIEENVEKKEVMEETVEATAEVDHMVTVEVTEVVTVEVIEAVTVMEATVEVIEAVTVLLAEKTLTLFSSAICPSTQQKTH